jgi:quinol monooxygenase YgiN
MSTIIYTDKKKHEFNVMHNTHMSLIVNIYYTGEGDNAKKFAEEMVSSGIVDRVRAEEGNERYEYFFPMDDSQTVMLIDRWTD